MGRYVQVEQIVANAAREGARLASQGRTINDQGSPTEIVRSVPPPNTLRQPNVKAAVMQYLAGAGLQKLHYEDVDVTFQFIASRPGDPALVGPIPGAVEPFQGVQNQRFQVSVTISDRVDPNDPKSPLKPEGQRPLRERVLWSTLGIVKPDVVNYQVEWVMLVDRPYTVNATLPSW